MDISREIRGYSKLSEKQLNLKKLKFQKKRRWAQTFVKYKNMWKSGNFTTSPAVVTTKQNPFISEQVQISAEQKGCQKISKKEEHLK